MKMKNYLASLFAVLMIAIAVPASGQYTGYLTDTLTTSGATGTVYLYPGGTTSAGAATAAAAKAFTVPGELSVIMYSDSLSGGTNATLYVEVANTSSPNLWYPVSTTTLNGATTQKIEFTDTNFTNLKWRINCTAPSSTQSTRLRAEWRFKPTN
jgi:hypothetical protein